MTQAIQNRQQQFRAYDALIFTRRFIVSLIAVLAGLAAVTACSNSTQSTASDPPGSGNWQFQLTTDGSFTSPAPDPNCPQPMQQQDGPPIGLMCASGFLLQNNGAITGQLQYAIVAPPISPFCNSGTASVTGTISEGKVALTASAGPETFTFTGQISSDGSTMSGSYTSDGKGCGHVEPGPASATPATWKAQLIPPMSGPFQGVFHNDTDIATLGKGFPVSGFLTQAPNIGAGAGSVTGILNMQNHSCLTTASLNGQISGSSAILQIIAPNGVPVGQIGSVPNANSPNAPTSLAFPVSFNPNPSTGEPVLQGTFGYAFSAGKCTGERGDICLALGVSTTTAGAPTACTQPVTFTPASLTFPSQLIGSATTFQTVTVTNTDPSGAVLNPILFFASDRFGVDRSFSEHDTCTPSGAGGSFSLAWQKSCTITIGFSPQLSCDTNPNQQGIPPSQCPPFLSASPGSPPALEPRLFVCKDNSNGCPGDNHNQFGVPISGIGLSWLQPSVPELDFGAEQAAPDTNPENANKAETSPEQSFLFTNQGTSAVMIPASDGSCGTLGTLPGVQVVNFDFSHNPFCDANSASTGQPNFKISTDECSNRILQPQESCRIGITYQPQPGAVPIGSTGIGLDELLQLNTVKCTPDVSANCEIDSGRYPVEVKANSPSPLRMFPGAGLDFPTQARNTTSPPLSITLTNDAQAGKTVTFLGNVGKGDFAESDDCGRSLAPGSSCTINVVFIPTTTGYEQGTLTISYTTPDQPVAATQVIFMRGMGQ